MVRLLPKHFSRSFHFGHEEGNRSSCKNLPSLQLHARVKQSFGEKHVSGNKKYVSRVKIYCLHLEDEVKVMCMIKCQREKLKKKQELCNQQHSVHNGDYSGEKKYA